MSASNRLFPPAAVVQTDCEFCQELRDAASSRFHRLYGGRVESRVIARGHGLLAMPTLGQIFPHSLLVLPEEHKETMADVYHVRGRRLVDLVAEVERRVRPFDTPVVFEHGARCESGGSCGIYHAHLHVVPVPGPVSCTDLLPADEVDLFSSLEAAWAALAGSSEYLLFRGTDGRVGVHDSSRSPRRFGSQYFRRELVRRFQVERPWDWRVYDEPEPDLLQTLSLAGDVPVG